jgi:phage tail sheath protein FI
MGDKKKPKKSTGSSGGTYLSPGVYVEEVPAASKPIEAVGTSVAAFVGFAPMNPVRLAATALVVVGSIAAVKRVLAS